MLRLGAFESFQGIFTSLYIDGDVEQHGMDSLRPTVAAATFFGLKLGGVRGDGGVMAQTGGILIQTGGDIHILILMHPVIIEELHHSIQGLRSVSASTKPRKPRALLVDCTTITNI